MVFVVVLIEHWPQATLVEESGRREAAIRTCRPLPPLNNTHLLKFTTSRLQRQTPGGAGRMGVLGRRTRGEPTSELSERTSQPPPSTTSGHCMRVRPGSPITYVHDKVVALKHPTVPAPPAAWSPPRTVSTQTSTALATRQMSLLQNNTAPNPISISRY